MTPNSNKVDCFKYNRKLNLKQFTEMWHLFFFFNVSSGLEWISFRFTRGHWVLFLSDFALQLQKSSCRSEIYFYPFKKLSR